LEINKTVIVASSWSSIFTLPTLMMHGQTQIKLCTLVFLVFGPRGRSVSKSGGHQEL
jgi:hypothetical protein